MTRTWHSLGFPLSKINPLDSLLDVCSISFAKRPATQFRQLPSPHKILSIIGLCYTASLIVRLGDFAWFHFLRFSDLQRYYHLRAANANTQTKDQPIESSEWKAEEVGLDDNNAEVANTTGEHDSSAWALVTGASSGIGLGYATALLENGFNVILHGRNPTKLARIKADFFSRFPTRQVDTLILDAEHVFSASLPSTAENGGIFDTSVRSRFQDRNITILVNNVGGPGTLSDAYGLCTPHGVRPTTHNLAALNINILFPVEITRALLPILSANAPSLILNVGSASGRLPMPLLGVPGAVKAFQEAWSRSLDAEMRYLGMKGLDVRYDLVGMCATPGGGGGRKKSWLCPDGEGYARKSLGLGSAAGRVVTYGYWPHRLVFGGLLGWFMPDWVVKSAVAGIVRNMVDEENR